MSIFSRLSDSLGMPIVLSLSFLVSCANDSEFAGRSKFSKSQRGNGELTGEDPNSVGGERKSQTFTHIASIDTARAPSQYLVVMDNSVSMGPYLSKVKKGFASIPVSTFPEVSEIAVMNTMISSYTDPSKTHAGIKDYTDIQLEPGYLDFVDGAAIDKFKSSSAPSDRKRPFSKKGCDKWTKPGEKNSDGDSCIDAHLQIAASAIRCEPGMHAFEQLVTQKAMGLFKEGHQLQVIFVSDETGPGCSDAELTAKCPSAAELKSKAMANSKGLLDVRFHGIVQAGGQCDYTDVVRENSGKLLDIKSASTNSYKDIIESIVTEELVGTATFKLESEAVEITSILIDGVEHDGSHAVAGDMITISDLPEKDKLEIKIDYISK